MKELKIGGKQVRVRATALALLYYMQEFKSPLLVDFTKIQTVVNGVVQFDHVLCLQLIWAMAKAETYCTGQQFPSFEMWLNSFEHIDLSDTSFPVAALEEATAGFLGGGKTER